MNIAQPVVACVLALAGLLAGCGSAPQPQPAAESKPAAPAIPEDVQAAARILLGGDAEILLFGDLAKTGRQQFLAVDRPPKPPNGLPPGGIITRAVIAESDNGKWTELLRCDEHLKNTKGFLGLTPLEPVTGWRLQYEQNAEKGLQLYFTPLQLANSSHPVTVGVRWNLLTRRYQSLDRGFQSFLAEMPALQNAQSVLR